MVISKHQGYLLRLILVSTLSASIQSVSALTTQTVNNPDTGVTRSSISQVMTSTTLPDSTFIPLAPHGLRIHNADTTKIISIALSPDGKTLLVLISDDNPQLSDKNTRYDFADSILNPLTSKPNHLKTSKAQWVFVYDVSAGMLVKQQQISIPRTHNGLAWSKDGQQFYVSGATDSHIYVYALNRSQNKLNTSFSNYGGVLLKEIPAMSITTEAVVVNVQHVKRGTLVSTSYNTISMLRTMDDLQNIGYLGINDVNAEAISDVLNRELNLTTHLALMLDNYCNNFVDFKLPSSCQERNVEKTATMLMIYEKNWSAQMTKNFSFEVENQLEAEKYQQMLGASMNDDFMHYSE